MVKRGETNKNEFRIFSKYDEERNNTLKQELQYIPWMPGWRQIYSSDEWKKIWKDIQNRIEGDNVIKVYLYIFWEEKITSAQWFSQWFYPLCLLTKTHYHETNVL